MRSQPTLSLAARQSRRSSRNWTGRPGALDRLPAMDRHLGRKGLLPKLPPTAQGMSRSLLVGTPSIPAKAHGRKLWKLVFDQTVISPVYGSNEERAPAAPVGAGACARAVPPGPPADPPVRRREAAGHVAEVDGPGEDDVALQG